MLTPFLAKGLNPTTGRMIELVLMAESAQDARRQIEDCGVKFVTLTPHPAALDARESQHDVATAYRRRRTPRPE
jgi:hypothetical protein